MNAEEAGYLTIGKGGLPELLSIELRKVAANVADPNTKATAQRKIVIDITLTPYPDRSGTNCEFTCKATLGQTDASAMNCSLFLAKRDGVFTFFTRDLRQEMLFTEEPPNGKSAGAAD